MKSKSQRQRESFALALPPIILLGMVLAGAFFGLVILGPFDNSLLRRYCLGHPIAVTCVCLFFVGLVALLLKWSQAFLQQTVTHKSKLRLQQLAREGTDIVPSMRAEWLEANWQGLPSSIADSWLGSRVRQIVEMQISRGRQHQLESDLKMTSEADGDRQHDSYSLVRIINWAMPMLGFLGTVLGISQTLGQLDTQKLATQQQEAMNELTAGLYVAFDTTAIALILTVFLMFLQFAVSRLEVRLLTIIDSVCHRELIEFLGTDPFNAQEVLLAPVREMTEQLTRSIENLVESQAQVWTRTMDESHKQWQTHIASSAQHLDEELGKQLQGSLTQHTQDLQELFAGSSEHFDQRWQQWQTTLSDQARALQDQQREMTLQCDYLQQLVGSLADLQKLDVTVQQNLSQLENVGRLEQASHCIGEAVAVLATSLERSGVIRGVPIRPRTKSTEPPANDSSSEPSDNEEQGKAA